MGQSIRARIIITGALSCCLIGYGTNWVVGLGVWAGLLCIDSVIIASIIIQNR